MRQRLEVGRRNCRSTWDRRRLISVSLPGVARNAAAIRAAEACLRQPRTGPSPGGLRGRTWVSPFSYESAITIILLDYVNWSTRLRRADPRRARRAGRDPRGDVASLVPSSSRCAGCASRLVGRVTTHWCWASLKLSHRTPPIITPDTAEVRGAARECIRDAGVIV